MSEKIAESAEQSKLVRALRACREQLEIAHDEITGGGDGCDGTCSYREALKMADEALAEVGAS